MKEELTFFSWKRAIIIILVGIGIFLLIPKIIGLKQIVELLKQVKYWAFVLALFSESFFYIGSAILTRSVLKMTGDKLKFFDMIRISLLDSFSVQFLPLSSLGEGAVDYYFLRTKNVRTSHIILMFIARTIMVYLIFAFIYLVGVAFSPTNPNLGSRALLVVWIVYFAAFGLLFYLISLYYRKSVLYQRAVKVANLINRLGRIIKFPRIPIERIPEMLEKIYEAAKILANNRRVQVQAIIGAFLFWAGDIFCLYFSLLGFGYKPHLPIIIFAYCIARILSLISLIPGGLGIAEGTLSLILIGFGVPAGTALAGVFIFRFISFWVPIPVGLGSFLSLRKIALK